MILSYKQIKKIAELIDQGDFQHHLYENAPVSLVLIDNSGVEVKFDGREVKFDGRWATFEYEIDYNGVITYGTIHGKSPEERLEKRGKL